MALDPVTIQTERAKLPQIQVNGKIISSSLINKENECLHTYESIISTDEQNISFEYNVLVNDCTTDSIYDIESKPFLKDSTVTLNLTQETPHKMVSNQVTYPPQTTYTPRYQSENILYIIGFLLFVTIIGVVIGILVKNKIKKAK